MATPAELEIYRQRYETYRHLDRLRWQMLPVAVGAGAAILAFARYRSEPVWWMFLGVGLLLVISGVAMRRIGQGINRNGEVLRKIAATIGDKDIPPVGKWLKSVAFPGGIQPLSCGQRKNVFMSIRFNVGSCHPLTPVRLGA